MLNSGWTLEQLQIRIMELLRAFQQPVSFDVLWPIIGAEFGNVPMSSMWDAICNLEESSKLEYYARGMRCLIQLPHPLKQLAAEAE